jgi:hypothetical protein
MCRVSIGSHGPRAQGDTGWLRASHRAEMHNMSTAMRPFLAHQKEPVEPGKSYALRVRCCRCRSW